MLQPSPLKELPSSHYSPRDNSTIPFPHYDCKFLYDLFSNLKHIVISFISDISYSSKRWRL